MIHAKGLTRRYDEGTEVNALAGVNFDVKEGDFVAILGPSGSGKSTLLNLLGTLDRPTDGHLTINGVEVSQLGDDALADFRRKHIGFVFQLFNLIPSLTALDNVILPLIPYKRGLDFDLVDRAKSLLHEVGLGQRMGHLPGQLSGGEQQRVAIARALINKPALLLGDEPTGNLDSQRGREILDLLTSLNQENGITIVMVTHDMGIASQAKHSFSIRDGKISNGYVVEYTERKVPAFSY